MKHSKYQVVVLSENARPSGLLFSGSVTVDVKDNESLADAVLRHLRSTISIDINNGDIMFFPTAEPNHRYGTVVGDHVTRVQVIQCL